LPSSRFFVKRLVITGFAAIQLLAFSSAQAQTAEKAPLPTSGALGAVVGLAVVVALIFALGWLMRRFNGGTGLQRGPLRVLGATSVGQRERVVLVRYQDSILILGVAQGQVSLLKEAPAPAEPPAAEAAALPSFVARLRALGGAGPHA
jgi:flagellar protein FliO/FliZ